MEAVGIIARLENLNADDVIDLFNSKVVDTVFPSDGPMGIVRRCAVTWLFLYVGSLLVYFSFATLDYLICFKLLGKKLLPPNYESTTDKRREITMSVKSLAVMAAFSTPAEVAVHFGYAKVYTDPAQHGYWYLFLSPLLFVAFSDCLIYFIHRGLHHRWIYKYIHKPHHSFINTTPYAAFAFHPVDGFLQGTSYQMFIFILPFHAAVHLVSLVLVAMWTINIHDRLTLGIPGINGAAHHTIHHTTFRSNYGQYTTFWDQVFGTFRDPHAWSKSGALVFTEKEVYGKDA